jgi:hypothetical protein
MMRTLNVVLIGAMLAGAGVVYHLKYESERAANRISKLTRKLEQERQGIVTLKAEWSVLNQPRRLQEFAERYHTYLELDRLDPSQIATIDEIPFRPASDAGAAAVQAGAPKPLVTGSVKKPDEKAPKPADKVVKPGDKPVKTVDPRPNDPINSFLR